MEKSAYRKMLGSFLTGVTVIATFDGEGEPWGLTANSFCSVSLDPALGFCQGIFFKPDIET